MIQLISVEPNQHRDLFEIWVRSEHVARWWGDPAMRLSQFDDTSGPDNAIIALDGTPIGYIRWEVVDPDALAAIGLRDIPPGSIDMDICIGDPGRVGRGVGPAALSLAFVHLKSKSRAPLVGLCTSVENAVAHRAFQKAGCSRHARFDDDTFGSCWVFVRRLREETVARPLPAHVFVVSERMPDERRSFLGSSKSALPEDTTPPQMLHTKKRGFQMHPRHIRLMLACVFLGLGSWALVLPGQVLSLGLRPEFYSDDPALKIIMGCFGAQAVLGGLVMLLSRFTPTTFLVFSIAGSVPFFGFNYYFVFVFEVFTRWMLLDFVGNFAILALCLWGYVTMKKNGLDTA